VGIPAVARVNARAASGNVMRTCIVAIAISFMGFSMPYTLALK
jgi:hypothetical protein